MIKVEIYTDGSCNQTTKEGGWAFLMLENGVVKTEKRGSESETTNNKCEMIAAIQAINELGSIEFSEEYEVVLRSDSAYLVNAFNQGWITGWLRNGWMNSEKKPVENKYLWEQLIELKKKYNVYFEFIKRRSNQFAKKVDSLAKSK